VRSGFSRYIYIFSMCTGSADRRSPSLQMRLAAALRLGRRRVYNLQELSGLARATKLSSVFYVYRKYLSTRSSSPNTIKKL